MFKFLQNYGRMGRISINALYKNNASQSFCEALNYDLNNFLTD
jgi:hypothetical protein